MRKKTESQKNYREEIFNLIKESYIDLPDHYNYTKEEVFAYLNKRIVSINKNYGRIIFILNAIFKVNNQEIDNWSKRFNDFVAVNASALLKIEHHVNMYGPNCLTESSKSLFCNYVTLSNQLVNDLSILCSKALNILKRNPEDNAVFIVHGHDEKLKTALKKALASEGHNPIVLSDMNDSGITLFDKVSL